MVNIISDEVRAALTQVVNSESEKQGLLNKLGDIYDGIPFQSGAINKMRDQLGMIEESSNKLIPVENEIVEILRSEIAMADIIASGAGINNKVADAAISYERKAKPFDLNGLK